MMIVVGPSFLLVAVAAVLLPATLPSCSNAFSFVGRRRRRRGVHQHARPLPTPTAATSRSRSQSSSPIFATTLDDVDISDKSPSSSSSSSSSQQSRRRGPWVVNDDGTTAAFQNDWEWVYSGVDPAKAVQSNMLCEEIEGTIPSDLQGTYYKNGPANFQRGDQYYEHVLDGDGFITAFTFKEGKCHYTGRFVETDYYLEEQASNNVMYRNVFGTQPANIFQNFLNVNLKNVANTNVVKWGGRLFTLWEGGRPYELDPDTLETLSGTTGGFLDGLGNPDCALRAVTIDEGGPVDEKADMGRAFTAHPHVVDDGNTIIAFRQGQDPREKNMLMEFVEYDRNFQLKRSNKYTIPKSPIGPHDFSVSNDYYAFFQNRLDIDNLLFLLGLKSPTQVMQLSLDQPEILHLVPRAAGGKALKLELPPYFCIHMIPEIEANYGGDKNKIAIYSTGWNVNDERFFPLGAKKVPFLGAWGGKAPDTERIPSSNVYRTVIDMQNEKIVSHTTVLPDLVMEFPTQDPVASENLYFGISSCDDELLPPTGICKLNTATEEQQYWWTETGMFTNEVTPVPKRNGEPGSWIIGIVHDAEQRRASVAILDSEDFEAGPVCRIHLPFHLTFGIHGSFCSNV